jgi:hypothetical protein
MFQNESEIELSDSDAERARNKADSCANFMLDDDDEIIDDTVSCINCAFRRWTRDTYTCMNSK